MGLRQRISNTFTNLFGRTQYPAKDADSVPAKQVTKKPAKKRGYKGRIQPNIPFDNHTQGPPLTPNKRKRKDGKANCQVCKNNRFATVKKSFKHDHWNDAKLVKCRFCNTLYITVDGKIVGMP
ncbi:MAG: hypothetical protein HN932_12830 [Candidatus Marinimicrobia bacterium]|jgi:hypothetical protein|nr:hypothetical protein [Candidatus Neomarinimicrobiota bacterium]MBT7339098.1 hypothetical protein [Candidatus Jacksonbacteria bacterium]